jgi:hypothetical protein
MAQCRIHLERSLPAVCLCCDANASHYSRQTFINTNPWTLWTTFLGTWYYNWIVLHIPLCDAHRNTIKYRWVAPFTFLVLGGLGIFASWGAYNSLYGKEAGDAIGAWVGGAVAIVVAIFYLALLYSSFTKPHVSKVQGDYITLSRVSERFAAAVRGDDVAVMVAEFADETPLAHYAQPQTPVASLVAPQKQRKAGAPWMLILLSIAGVLSLVSCGIGLALLRGAKTTQPVQISAERVSQPFLLNAAAQLKITFRATSTLSDGDGFMWVIQHGDTTLRPRFTSAAELRQGGVVDFHVFDPQADRAQIWLETIPFGGGEPRKISNVATVKTR